MDIIRVPRDSGLRKHFQDLAASGIFSDSPVQFERWRWKYAGNPFFPAQDLPCWVYLVEGKIAGHLGAIPVSLKAGSEKARAAWAIDFMTLAEFRKRGIGRALVEEAEKHSQVFLTVGQTDMSFNLFMKMGWIHLGKVPYYIKIWDARALIQEKVKSKFLAVLFSASANIGFAVFNYFKGRRAHPDIVVSFLENFDAEADSFWQEIAPHYKIAVERNYSYLHWKYDLQPDMQYVKIRAARNGKICGYVILRVIQQDSNPPEGLVADILVHPADQSAVEALLSSATRYLKSRGCPVARCYLNHKTIERSLEKFGFIRRRPYMRFLISKKMSQLEGIERLDNWYLSAGDCDIDR